VINGKIDHNPPGKTSVIQPIFTLKLDHQSLLQVVRRLPHNLAITTLKNILTRYLDMALTGIRPQCGLGSEVDQLSSEITLVLGRVLVERGRQSRIVPCCCLCVVVDKVDSSSRRQTHFPSARQGPELCDGLRLHGQTSCSSGRANNSQKLLTTRVDPGGCTGIVIDEIRSTFGSESLFPSGRERTCTGSCRHGPTCSQQSITTCASGRTCGIRRRSRGAIRSTSSSIKHIIRQTSLVVPGTRISRRRSLLRRV
jgi:hypothetical protein